MTENWKPPVPGGRSSRGWGVIVDGTETAAALAAVPGHIIKSDSSGLCQYPLSRTAICNMHN